MRLRQATELTGSLHEAQLFQMKVWCAVLFDRGSTVEIINKADQKLISYIVKNKVDNLKDRAAQACDWTRTILGNTWSVSVKDKTGKRAKIVHSEGAV